MRHTSTLSTGNKLEKKDKNIVNYVTDQTLITKQVSRTNIIVELLKPNDVKVIYPFTTDK